MALSMATMRKQLLPQLNTLFAQEYSKYRFREASNMSDVLGTESDQHKQLRLADTQMLRDIWIAAFADRPTTVDEISNMHGTDIWIVGSELYKRRELREGNRPEYSEEVYLLKPHANS